MKSLHDSLTLSRRASLRPLDVSHNSNWAAFQLRDAFSLYRFSQLLHSSAAISTLFCLLFAHSASNLHKLKVNMF